MDSEWVRVTHDGGAFVVKAVDVEMNLEAIGRDYVIEPVHVLTQKELNGRDEEWARCSMQTWQRGYTKGLFAGEMERLAARDHLLASFDWEVDSLDDWDSLLAYFGLERSKVIHGQIAVRPTATETLGQDYGVAGGGGEAG
jgi:hypothetical protein